MGKFKLRWCQHSPNTITGAHCQEKEVVFYENGLNNVYQSEVFCKAEAQYKKTRRHDTNCGSKNGPRLFSVSELEYNINVRGRV